MKNTKAFTMVELVFVIVVVGILTAVAIPKLVATRDDAEISKARATVAALRNAIATERQKNILAGKFDDINGSTAENLLMYGLGDNWSRTDNDFTYTLSDVSCTFTLNNNVLKRDENDSCTLDGLKDL